MLLIPVDRSGDGEGPLRLGLRVVAIRFALISMGERWGFARQWELMSAE